MRCKIDENIPVEAAGLLNSAGWPCHTVYDEALGGASDDRVSAICRSEERVLFTLDLDFADIRAYPPSDYLGIVVFRPHEPSRDAVLRLLARAIPTLIESWADRRLWIVEPGRIRVRRSEPAV